MISTPLPLLYHAGPPKVVQVAVPVTQKPYVVQVGWDNYPQCSRAPHNLPPCVQVPQNVPVRFVPVNVPTQPPPRPQVVQVQGQASYSQPQHIHHYPGI